MEANWSRYNFLVEYKEKKLLLLYNAYTNNLIEFSDSQQQESILSIKKRGKVNIDDDFSKELYDNYILVEDDNILAHKVRLSRLNSRFASTRMNLTLAPTVACNFACPYCYESASIKGVMSEETENRIVALVKSYKSLETLNVDWYGGEPLLAFDTMVRLTKKLQELSIPRYRAILVTNGYLLEKKVNLQLKSLGIDRIQITIDGLEKTHNMRRPHKTNPDSFQVIVQNIQNLFEVYPEVVVNIRVNVDKDNADEFFELNEYLHNKIKSSTLFLYPAYITEYNNSCKNQFCLMDRMDQAQFILNNEDKYQFGRFYYPLTRVGECSARYMSGYIIGPTGESYKCWCDVGDESKIIGNLKEGITNSNLYTRYMSESDPLSDPRCMECSCLPICNGGCTLRRLKYKDDLASLDNLCTVQKDNMDKFIKLYYNYHHRS